MYELLKRSFVCLVKMRWLKEIDKANDQYKKAKAKAERKLYVLCALMDAYEEKYKEDLRGTEDA